MPPWPADRIVEPMTIRVLTVDDHAVVRAGIAAMLATGPDIEIVGEAALGVHRRRLRAVRTSC
jgi:DNA-binding NarL/FixJ family response regulator